MKLSERMRLIRALAVRIKMRNGIMPDGGYITYDEAVGQLIDLSANIPEDLCELDDISIQRQRLDDLEQEDKRYDNIHSELVGTWAENAKTVGQLIAEVSILAELHVETLDLLKPAFECDLSESDFHRIRRCLDGVKERAKEILKKPAKGDG